MSQRLANTFTASRPAFIPFLMAGDPVMEISQQFLNALPAAGADVIEIGMPFSDPMADGPVIDAAGKRALANGMNLPKVLEMVHQFRKTSQTPVILMGYYNPIYHYGVEKFCKDAGLAGVDGMLIVDLPPEEESELLPHLKRNHLDLIRLIAPTTPPDRIKLITKHASGFIYYVSVKGITGDKSVELASLQEAIARIKATTTVPVAAGFGIKTPAQATEAAKAANAVVVGSALVEALHQKGLNAALELARSLSTAVKA